MMQSLALQFIIHLLINGKFGIIKKQTENIRKALDQFLWVTHFTNIDVTEKVNLFNKTMKNTLNYILHETITCNVRDSPWINKDIKEPIHEFQACKSYSQNKNNIFSLHQFELLQSELNSLIEKHNSTTTLAYPKNYLIP